MNESILIVLVIGAFISVCCGVAILTLMLLSGLFTTAKETFLSLVRPTGEERLLRDLLRDSKKKREESESKAKLKDLLAQLNSSVGTPSEFKVASQSRQQASTSPQTNV